MDQTGNGIRQRKVQTMRLFIAIQLSDEMKKALVACMGTREA